MAELLPIAFPLPSESSIASYSYTDIADGTGVITFNGSSSKADATETYFLTNNNLRSHSINVQAVTTGSASHAKNLDLDFDLTSFNSPRILKGTCRGNITIGGRTTSAAPNDWSAYAIIKLRKLSGATETEIANTQTETTTGGGGAVNSKDSKEMTFTINALTQTSFKIGDILRVTVEIWSLDNGGTNTGFGIDPANRTDTTALLGGIIEDADDTIFRIDVPFKLNL